LVLLPTAAAMCGPVLIRRRITLEHLVSNNEIAGFKFATVGVMYAVLLAFAVIVVWQKYSEAETAVVQEAGAAATSFRLASGPEPEAVVTRAALSDYLKLVIKDDFAEMADGKESRAVTKALNSLYAAALRLTEAAPRQQATFSELFTQLDLITQARRIRLHAAGGSVPQLLWFVLFVGAFLTVGFTFFFGTENLPAQVLMTGILAANVFTGLLLILSMNYPFSGPVHIGSEPLSSVLEDFSAR